jgi:2-amino-4-hydroxy-6-hydroxymethyldihydropteridine diphosphokinase
MIFLGIGSNLSSTYGNRFSNIDFAIEFLLKEKITLIKKSNFYETESFPNKNNPRFINVIISIDTSLSPEKIAEIILNIEKKLERKRDKKNDPRTCDIDIIDYRGKVISFSFNDLVFSTPHKQMVNRNFVLFPLKEVCPNWRHPINNELVNVLIEKLPTEDKNSILKVDKT